MIWKRFVVALCAFAERDEQRQFNDASTLRVGAHRLSFTSVLNLPFCLIWRKANVIRFLKTLAQKRAIRNQFDGRLPKQWKKWWKPSTYTHYDNRRRKESEMNGWKMIKNSDLWSWFDSLYCLPRAVVWELIYDSRVWRWKTNNNKNFSLFANYFSVAKCDCTPLSSINSLDLLHSNVYLEAICSFWSIQLSFCGCCRLSHTALGIALLVRAFQSSFRI